PAEPIKEAPKPAAKPTESAPPPAKPAEAAAPKGYVVQLGVFSNPANAQQLQAKLIEHGIQSYTETRLNVGPFQSKAEADRALAKIRELGINAVVVPNR
ncbi:MAG: SPOR domain-containing protein, partial [Pseudomonadota bacterium]